MVSNKLAAVALLLGGFSVAAVQAEEVKNHSVGLTSSATTVIFDDEENTFSGLGLTYTGVFSDSGNRQWAGRITYASQEHVDFTSVTANALDASVLWGAKINRVGFKWYLSGGLFNEKWSAPGFSKTQAGLQLGGGIGYNWRPVSLDFWINLRNGGAYELGRFEGDAASNGGLSVGYRF